MATSEIRSEDFIVSARIFGFVEVSIYDCSDNHRSTLPFVFTVPILLFIWVYLAFLGIFSRPLFFGFRRSLFYKQRCQFCQNILQLLGNTDAKSGVHRWHQTGSDVYKAIILKSVLCKLNFRWSMLEDHAVRKKDSRAPSIPTACKMPETSWEISDSRRST